MLRNAPLVSILMPVYNSFDFVRSENENLLPQALDSLLAQTYKNFELIILDNQSSDDTAEVCRQYAANDCRVRYIYDSEKRFPEGGISRLAELANGQFCMVANDDDLWDENYIDRLMNRHLGGPPVDLVYSNGVYINIYGERLEKMVNDPLLVYGSSHSFDSLNRFIFQRNVIPLAFGIFRTETYRRFLPFEPFDALKANVDNLYIIKFFLAGGTTAFVDESLFLYRRKGRQLDPAKVPGMPKLELPILLADYYLQHQVTFANRIGSEILLSTLGAEERAFTWCTTIFGFFHHAAGLLLWICAEIAKTAIDREKLYKLANILTGLSSMTLEGVQVKPADIRLRAEVLLTILADIVKLLRVFEEHFFSVEVLHQLTAKMIADCEVLVEKSPEIVKSLKIRRPSWDKLKPRVSVISCSYNYSQFLRATIHSVLNQDYYDLELIVVDANSNDDSLKILEEYPEIRVISEPDQGYLDGFWKGLRVARGDLILQCAVSDGYLDPTWIRRCVETFDSNNDVSLVWGFPQYLSQDGVLGKVSYSQFFAHPPGQKEQFFEFWLEKFFWLPEGNFCVRRNALLECMPVFNEESKRFEPWLEFNYRFHASGRLAYHLPLIANFGRTHENQLGQREEYLGVAAAKMANYTDKSRVYLKQLAFGCKTHHLSDGCGSTITAYGDRKKFVKIYFKHHLSQHQLFSFLRRVKRRLYRALF